MEHPGTVLLKEFMQPRGISQHGLARALRIAPQRVNEIVNGQRKISTDTAIRLGLYFGNGASFWLGIQSEFEIEQAEKSGLFDEIAKEVHGKASSVQTSQQRIEDKTLEYHQEVARRVEKDPQGAIKYARNNMERWGWQDVNSASVPPYVKKWKSLIEGPIDELLRMLVSKSEKATLLRISSPFKGLLEREN